MFYILIFFLVLGMISYMLDLFLILKYSFFNTMGRYTFRWEHEHSKYFPTANPAIWRINSVSSFSLINLDQHLLMLPNPMLSLWTLGYLVCCTFSYLVIFTCLWHRWLLFYYSNNTNSVTLMAITIFILFKNNYMKND